MVSAPHQRSQTQTVCGIGKVHRIPPGVLKCLSEMRRRELAALVGGDQGSRWATWPSSASCASTACSVPAVASTKKKKQDLAAVKETWALFQQISADTKDLDDIPHYWPPMKRRGLPVIQYTARQVRSGLQFLAYASHRSAQASALFAQRVQSHFQRCGVHLPDVTWQTDNGGEFVGELQKDGSRSGFPRAVTFFGSQHDRIPPAAHTYQSDVETVHRLIEDEFFDLETFSSRAEFLAKASHYQLYFNLARPNSHKRGLTPWQIIQQLAPRLPLNICLLPPVFLDYRLNPQGGYDLPRLPSWPRRFPGRFRGHNRS